MQAVREEKGIVNSSSKSVVKRIGKHNSSSVVKRVGERPKPDGNISKKVKEPKRPKKKKAKSPETLSQNAWLSDPNASVGTASDFVSLDSDTNDPVFKETSPPPKEESSSLSSSSDDEENGDGRKRSFVPKRTIKQDAMLKNTKCAFCHGIGPGKRGEGDFLKPYRLRGETIYVHEWCARMSPMVYIDEETGRLVNVGKEVRRGRTLHCAFGECDKRGATMGCGNQDCKSSFHLACAALDGCVYSPSKGLL
eukprot:g2583.t1